MLRYCILGVLTLVLLFAHLPVPYTGVMLERQLSAWFAGKDQYQPQHQWRPLAQISPNLLQAVVAAEDQKFLQHSGFDLQAIEKALVYNSKGRKIRGASAVQSIIVDSTPTIDGPPLRMRSSASKYSPSSS